MTKIVEKHGSLFRLSDAAYRRLLELVIAEQEYDLWELGRCIGCIHASMGSFHRRKRPAAGRSGRSSIGCK